jgi:hypothetical protein
MTPDPDRRATHPEVTRTQAGTAARQPGTRNPSILNPDFRPPTRKSPGNRPEVHTPCRRPGRGPRRSPRTFASILH